VEQQSLLYGDCFPAQNWFMQGAFDKELQEIVEQDFKPGSCNNISYEPLQTLSSVMPTIP